MKKFSGTVLKICKYAIIPLTLIIAGVAVYMFNFTEIDDTCGNERIFVLADSELYFNRAEHAVGIAPMSWYYPDLDDSVFLQRIHDNEDIVRLFPLLDTLVLNMYGDALSLDDSSRTLGGSIVRKDDGSVVFLSITDQGHVNINIGSLLSGGVIVYDVDFAPVVSVVNGVDVTAFIVPTNDFRTARNILTAKFYVDGYEANVTVFVPLDGIDRGDTRYRPYASDLETGKSTLLQIVRAIITGEPGLSGLTENIG